MLSNNNKILIAMSGGVDSTVAALLLKSKSNNITSALMKLYSSDEIFLNVNNITKICKTLSINFLTFDLKKQFENLIIKKFIDEYIYGQTPNPCIICNRVIKFGLLKKIANNLGFNKIATGHYSRIQNINGTFFLLKARDLSKDQSYFLYSLKQEDLSNIIFPVGDLLKSEVRSIANENNFINANKKESQDICFIPNKQSYKDIIKKYYKNKIITGNIINIDNQIIGKHDGLYNYTIGQRKGINLNLNKKKYVIKKNLQNNTLVIDEYKYLYTDKLIAINVNFIPFKCLKETLIVYAKIRSSHTESKAKIFPIADNKVYVEFFEKQRSITNGQSIVFYDNEYVIGGGIISIVE